jgi:type VI secretion system protein ImpL
MKLVNEIKAALSNAGAKIPFDSIEIINKDRIGTILIIISVILLIIFTGKTIIMSGKMIIKKIKNAVKIMRDYIQLLRKNRQEKKPLLKKLMDFLIFTGDVIRSACCNDKWRYNTQWYIVTGGEFASSADMMSYLHSDERKIIQIKERMLEIENTRWHFFKKAVVIESEDYPTESASSIMPVSNWSTLLSALVRYRPERPADGIVLKLDAKQLLKLNEVWSADSANSIYHHLWEFQKVCGFIVPIYVVVTDCENVPGFIEFWSLQNEQQRKSIFGWSSPFSPGATFLPEWVDSAFQDMHQVLILSQAVKAAEASVDNLDNDAYFLFPKRFEELKGPLKRFLTVLFEKSTYNQSSFLRGIYFTGKISVVETDGVERGNLFVGVDDLFDNKIFSELNLATPLNDSLLSRNRLIRKVQYGLIAGSLMMIGGLVANTMQLSNHLDALSTSLSLIQNQPGDGTIQSDIIYKLIYSISEMRAESVFPFIPDSWFNKNGLKASAYVAETAFNKRIFPALSSRIVEKAMELQKFPEIDTINPIVSLTGYIDKIEAFEENLERFIYMTDTIIPRKSDTLPDGSRRPKIMRELSMVLKYLYGTTLSEEVIEREGVHQNALDTVGYRCEFIDSNLWNEYNPVVNREKLDSLFIPKPTYFLQNVADVTDSVSKLLIMSTILSEQTEQSLGCLLSESENYNCKMINPGQLLNNIGHWFDGIDNKWINKYHEQTPAGRVAQRWAEARKRLIPYGYHTDDFDRITFCLKDENSFSQVIEVLLKIRLEPYTRLFTLDTSGIVRVNENIKKEITIWRNLKNMSFIALNPEKENYVYCKPDGWNAAKLEQGLTYCREYQNFISEMSVDTLTCIPIMCRIAHSQLESVLENVIVSAQLTNDGNKDSETEVVLSKRADNLIAVNPLLIEMIMTLEQLDMPVIKEKLSTLSRIFASDILYTCDEIVNENRLYSYSNSPGWNDNNFASILFGLNDKNDVKKYCSDQLKKITDIADRYAQPAVQFLNNVPNDPSLNKMDISVKWQQTIEQINRNKRGDPVNAVKDIEEYFTGFLLLNSRNSVYNESENIADNRYDYFSLAKKNIQEMVEQYERNYNTNSWIKKYNTVSYEFNRSLAGKFPFGDSQSGLTTDEAPLDATRSFFYSFGPRIDSLKKEVRTNIFVRGKFKDVEEFLDNLGAVSTFFSYNLYKLPDENAPVSIRTRFRVNADNSPGSNQILRWQLSSENLLTEYPDSVSIIEWDFGKPFVFELQWAENSLYRPVQPTIDNPNISVDGSSIIYNYAGNWALIRLLKNHMTIQSKMIKNQNYSWVICRFEIPVNELLSRKTDKVQTICRAFLSIELFGIDTETKELKRIQFPLKFPAFAPEIKKEL